MSTHKDLTTILSCEYFYLQYFIVNALKIWDVKKCLQVYIMVDYDFGTDLAT